MIVGDQIGEGTASETAVIGETPNLAARLQALAEPNRSLSAPPPAPCWAITSTSATWARMPSKASPNPCWPGACCPRATPKAASPRGRAVNPCRWLDGRRKWDCCCAPGKAAAEGVVRSCSSRGKRASASPGCWKGCGKRPVRTAAGRRCVARRSIPRARFIPSLNI